MYGIIAYELRIILEARLYARKELPWPFSGIVRALGKEGPKRGWAVPGQEYRESAFDIGLAFAEKGGDLCTHFTGILSVSSGVEYCCPCPHRWTPARHTDWTTPALADESGN
jgi:hypothetical protein